MYGSSKVFCSAIGFMLSLWFLSPYSPAQALSNKPPNSSELHDVWGMMLAQPAEPDLAILNSHVHSQLEIVDEFVSVMDLKAPGKAVREYEKGHKLLLKKQFAAALEHLNLATSIYPNYVAAHNALGSAYLEMAKPQQARSEFSRAIELDDHLPISYINLGYAELTLNNYAAAEQSMLKASSISPLDLNMLTALLFTQYINHHFSAAIETCHKIHLRKHEGFARVHLLAAASWEVQRNFAAAKEELQKLLHEDPESSTLASVQYLTARIEHESVQPTATTLSDGAASNPVPPDRTDVSPIKEQLITEISEAAAEAETETENSMTSLEVGRTSLSGSIGNCATENFLASSGNSSGITDKTSQSTAAKISEYLAYRVFSDEVTVFFSATDHGRPVENLTTGDLHISDNHIPASAITSFRNESELPLRIGIVIDTSDSVTYRFPFEQKMAIDFLQNVVTRQDDLAFVMGFSTDVRIQQDFTADRSLLYRAIHSLAPSGRTALWDAVEYAAAKLATRPECQPVARILFVVSDGDDNSSDITAQHVITRAEEGQVSIYVVSARYPLNGSFASLRAELALKNLADLTGGSILDPASLHNGQKGRNLQQVIRNRYFVSYKPQSFEANGRYRPIEIVAKKDGHKLRIWARKGYFASALSESESFDGAF